MVSQLKEMGAEDKFDEVLQEIPRVRKDFGEPPLVTPSSQIVGTQAVMNVLMGERYKVVTKETKDLARGMYGKTPVKISDEMVKKLAGNEEVITCRPADLVPDGIPEAEKAVAKYKEQEEDVLSYALFPQVAEEFFKYRQAQKYKADPVLADTENKVYPV